MTSKKLSWLINQLLEWSLSDIGQDQSADPSMSEDPYLRVGPAPKRRKRKKPVLRYLPPDPIS